MKRQTPSQRDQHACLPPRRYCQKTAVSEKRNRIGLGIAVNGISRYHNQESTTTHTVDRWGCLIPTTEVLLTCMPNEWVSLLNLIHQNLASFVVVNKGTVYYEYSWSAKVTRRLIAWEKEVKYKEVWYFLNYHALCRLTPKVFNQLILRASISCQVEALRFDSETSASKRESVTHSLTHSHNITRSYNRFASHHIAYLSLTQIFLDWA